MAPSETGRRQLEQADTPAFPQREYLAGTWWSRSTNGRFIEYGLELVTSRPVDWRVGEPGNGLERSSRRGLMRWAGSFVLGIWLVVGCFFFAFLVDMMLVDW